MSIDATIGVDSPPIAANLPGALAGHPGHVMTSLPIRCTCGEVHGTLEGVADGRVGLRLSCLCVDCQTYAHLLGRADEILDADGGTDVVQVAPARVRIDEGLRNLRCTRLTDKGLFRWNARCCDSPIGNTVSSRRVPFIGVLTSCLDLSADERDARLGPVRASVNLPAGLERRPANAGFGAQLSVVLRSIGLLSGAYLRGTHRPHPFFGDDGTPIVTPEVADADEVAAARARITRSA